MKLQKLKFKKNLKKTKKKLDDSFSFIDISHCFLRLCLILCSIDDEHLIMNVLVYSDKEKTKKAVWI